MKLDNTKIKFNSHASHNPECDILEYPLDENSFITYGIHVSGKNKGEQFCEYYRGSNFVVSSNKTSYSRYFPFDQIPAKYLDLWIALKNYYIINHQCRAFYLLSRRSDDHIGTF